MNKSLFIVLAFAVLFSLIPHSYAQTVDSANVTATNSSTPTSTNDTLPEAPEQTVSETPEETTTEAPVAVSEEAASNESTEAGPATPVAEPVIVATTSEQPAEVSATETEGSATEDSTENTDNNTTVDGGSSTGTTSVAFLALNAKIMNLSGAMIALAALMMA